MKARFDKMNYRVCEWSISGKNPSELGVDQLHIFYPNLPCTDSRICWEETVKNVTSVFTYLTIKNPIDYVVDASILCSITTGDLLKIVSWYGIPKSK